ncbi:Fructokinase [Staphylococcus aureus]|uniref:Fructokinase n=1 Tax=Staphylococcus aureus TaxID=1280 RepID=A0A2X2K0W3_STAAU|nr:Fructokinase [Staphylococcus aureus]
MILNVNENDVVHFCSVDLVDSPMRDAHYQLITKTLNANGTVVFDPNVRLPLWDNAEDLRQTIHTFFAIGAYCKSFR